MKTRLELLNEDFDSDEFDLFDYIKSRKFKKEIHYAYLKAKENFDWVLVQKLIDVCAKHRHNMNSNVSVEDCENVCDNLFLKIIDSYRSVAESDDENEKYIRIDSIHDFIIEVNPKETTVAIQYIPIDSEGCCRFYNNKDTIRSNY